MDFNTILKCNVTEMCTEAVVCICYTQCGVTPRLVSRMTSSVRFGSTKNKNSFDNFRSVTYTACSVRVSRNSYHGLSVMRNDVLE